MSSCRLWVSVQLDSFFLHHTHAHTQIKGPQKGNSRSFVYHCMCVWCLGSLGRNICDFLQGHFPARQDKKKIFFLKINKFTFESEQRERHRDTGCDQTVASFKRKRFPVAMRWHRHWHSCCDSAQEAEKKREKETVRETCGSECHMRIFAFKLWSTAIIHSISFSA